MARHRIAVVGELWDGEMRGCAVEGRNLLLVKLDGCMHAYADRCPHLGMKLSAGTLEDGVITCAAHCFEFDARTGAGVNPRNARLQPYAVAVEGDDVLVELPTEESP
ncbi:MAG TPA: Rieske 2Fe-2S domain-containing protein [Nannocystaceae bacterium]|nr:Rieske 2Fe-2S domain-containing protein [Nannocystaceae bacterium]